MQPLTINSYCRGYTETVLTRMHASRMGGVLSPKGCLLQMGVYLVRGVSAPEGGVLSLGGVCSRGGVLSPGVSAPDGGVLSPGDVCSRVQRGVSAPGGSAPGGCLLLGGVSASGGCLLGGVCSRGGQVRHSSPPVDRMTHASENITLPQTSFAGSNNNADRHFSSFLVYCAIYVLSCLLSCPTCDVLFCRGCNGI